MPPRTDGELDATTLHNQALMNMDSGNATDVSGGGVVVVMGVVVRVDVVLVM